VTQPNQRLHHVRDVLDGLAYRTTEALEHILREEALIDGYPCAQAFDGTGRGTPEMTPTERLANARWMLRSHREQIRDDIDTIETLVKDYARMLDHVLRTRGPAPEREGARCDGKHRPGADVHWSPHSRDPENGWRDPLCGKEPVRDGLCGACDKRADRWAREHGYRGQVQVPAVVIGRTWVG
jgi:hypothetical protein